MKYTLFTFAIALISIAFYAYKLPIVDFKKDTKDGIQFFNGTFQEALEKAKAENKPIFLDIYATWCGPCKKLKKNTFSDKAVGEYYSKNYINIAINGETNEGRMLAEKYKIQGYPTLLIVDKNGKQLTKNVGFMDSFTFINFGKKIVP